MGVVAVADRGVDVDTGPPGQRGEELAQQPHVEVAGPILREGGVEPAVAAPAGVDGHLGQGVVHGDHGVPEASQRAALLHRPKEAFAHYDADVLHHVVGIDLQIARR